MKRQSEPVCQEEREYCLACESWEWPGSHCHFVQSNDPGARALAETDDESI